MPKLRVSRSGSRHKKEIALTFDDGPNPYSTNEILKILDDYKVSATFFVIGKRCLEYPEIIQEIHNRNHLIGNHTFSHCEGNFRACEQIIQQITGNSVIFVRPPFYNLSLCLNEIEYLQDKIIITGDVDSKDYLTIPENKLFTNVMRGVKNGSIVGFHDGSEIDFELEIRSKKTINILPEIINNLINLSYTFVRIDAMILDVREINVK